MSLLGLGSLEAASDKARHAAVRRTASRTHPSFMAFGVLVAASVGRQAGR
jgi:hypothetical protein